MNFYKVRVSYKEIKRKKDYQEYETFQVDEDNNIIYDKSYATDSNGNIIGDIDKDNVEDSNETWVINHTPKMKTESRPILVEEIKESEDPPYNVLISAASQEHALTVLRQEYCLEKTSTNPEDYETYFETVGRLLVFPTEPGDITIVKNSETGDSEDEDLLNMIFIQKNGAVMNVL